MKKQILLAFTAALGITLSVSAPVEAASANRVNISVFEKDCAADQWNSFEADSVNDLLKKYAIDFRQSSCRENVHRKYQKTTKTIRHLVHQKSRIRRRNLKKISRVATHPAMNSQKRILRKFLT